MKKLTPKEFALQQIAPYYKNPEICGYDKMIGVCEYLTKEGKMCVAGKNMLPKVRRKYRPLTDGIRAILRKYPNQEEIFIKKSVNILNVPQWQNLQILHDRIAKRESLLYIIDELNLFTLEELEEYCKTI